MLTLEEQVRLRVAAGALLRRGLLAVEDEPGLAAVLVGTRGYRYLSRFWTLVGVLEAKSVSLETARDLDRARRRIAATWIEAGAPEAWAVREASAALALIGVPEPALARAGSAERKPARAPRRARPRRR
jgi:hypothetical protein